jgi:colanic acid/amylovoran biosynthesis glycosyltransferase
MRLVYVVSQYPSLTETFVAREMEELVQLGNEIIICPLRPPVKTKGPSGLTVSGAQVLRSPLTPWDWLAAQTWLLWRDPAAWRACWRDVLLGTRNVPQFHHLLYILLVTTWLARDLQNREVDHIRGHFLHSEAISSMWLSRMLGISYSLTVHTVSLYYPYEFIIKPAQKSKFLIADTSEVYDFLERIRKNELYLIRNGISLAELPFKESNCPTSELPTVLGIGTLIEKKGFDVLLHACSILHQQGVSFICRIVGDGEERPHLEDMIRELGLEQMVQMPGSLPFEKLIKEYATASIFVVPSKDSRKGSDGLPTVLIESMALGVPVVATRKAGIPDLVKDGETGLIAEPNAPVSLAECLQRLLMDQEMQKQFSIAGRRLVEKKFDIRKSILRLVQLINEYSVNQLNVNRESDCCNQNL